MRAAGPVAGAAAIAAALALGGCSGGDHGSSTSTRDAQPQRGGTLTILWKGDVDSIDPGVTYTVSGAMIVRATQRTLLSFRPGDPTHPVPDLAAALPGISADGRTRDGAPAGGSPVLRARRPAGHRRRREIRHRARLLPDRGQRIRRPLLRRRRGREAGRRAGHADPGHRDPRRAHGRLPSRARQRPQLAGRWSCRSPRRSRASTRCPTTVTSCRPTGRTRSHGAVHARALQGGPSASTSSAIRAGIEPRTSGPPIWTRSTSARATTRRPRPRAASCAARDGQRRLQSTAGRARSGP